MLCTQGTPSEEMLDTASSAGAPSDAKSSDIWYVAYTKPRHERIAETNLNRQAFQTYLPLFKTFKMPSARTRSQTDGSSHGSPRTPEPAVKGLTSYEPMFPRYLFFRPSSPKQSIAAARSSRGVSHLVSFGSELAQASSDLLEIIREVESHRNRLELDAITPFQPGALVRLRDNPLAGMEGVIHAVGAKRVLLLMEVLGQRKLVKVKPGQIEIV